MIEPLIYRHADEIRRAANIAAADGSVEFCERCRDALAGNEVALADVLEQIAADPGLRR